MSAAGTDPSSTAQPKAPLSNEKPAPVGAQLGGDEATSTTSGHSAPGGTGATPLGGTRGALRLGGTRGALKRYQVMAMVVGTGLAIVCFIGIPLQVAGGNKWPWTAVVEIVGTAHGIFYIVYLLACLDLASRARFRLSQLLGMVCSGFLPLLAFYMERRVTRRVEALLALGPSAPPAPAAVLMSVLGRRRSAGPSAEPRPEGR